MGKFTRRCVIKDYAGVTIDHLTAIRDSGKNTTSGTVLWECVCRCGKADCPKVFLVDSVKIGEGRAENHRAEYKPRKSSLVREKNKVLVQAQIDAKRHVVSSNSPAPAPEQVSVNVEVTTGKNAEHSAESDKQGLFREFLSWLTNRV